MEPGRENCSYSHGDGGEIQAEKTKCEAEKAAKEEQSADEAIATIQSLKEQVKTLERGSRAAFSKGEEKGAKDAVDGHADTNGYHLFHLPRPNLLPFFLCQNQLATYLTLLIHHQHYLMTMSMYPTTLILIVLKLDQDLLSHIHMAFIILLNKII